MQDEIKSLLGDTFTEMGESLKASAQELAQYTAERVDHLATCVGQPGFEQAVIAERDNVALRAGIAAVEEGNAVDQRRLRIITRILQIAATALAAL